MAVKVERRMIGIVEVDSGTVIISDPAYALPRSQDSRPGMDYSVVLRDLTGAHATQLDGQGVVLLSNFGGDGPYPVFGEFEDGEFMRAIIEFEPLEI